MADPAIIEVPVNASPSVIEVTVDADPAIIEVEVPGQQGPPGQQGEPGVSVITGELDMPSLALLFDNRLA